MNIREELNRILFIALTYIIALSVVTMVVAPVQRMFIPEVTLFAALIFPPHGVRVLAAWFFGWRSFVYLYLATTIAHFVLTPDAPLEFKSFISWTITSGCAALSFSILQLVKFDVSSEISQIRKDTWQKLMLVAFVSSILNSIGHNLLFAGQILPENSLKTLLAFMVGDTLGTFVAFFALMLVFRALRPRSFQR